MFKGGVVVSLNQRDGRSSGLPVTSGTIRLRLNIAESALGHSATRAGDALMSEKGYEPDIEPLRSNVAEVPALALTI